jgi:hypothetical protein
MSDVKALFPIGKTQWRKWNNDQREAFNEARAADIPFGEAVAASNSMQVKPKKNILDILGDVVETVTDVAEVAVPAIAVVKTVKRAVRNKKAK